MNLTGDEGIQTFKATIIEQLDRRFHNFTLNEIYCMATYLDPRFKNRFLSDSMMASIKSTIENNRTVADQHVNIEQTANFWDAVDTTVQQSTDSLQNEILAYTSLQKAEMSLTDPLQYWKQESRFPLLKATAKNIYQRHLDRSEVNGYSPHAATFYRREEIV